MELKLLVGSLNPEHTHTVLCVRKKARLCFLNSRDLYVTELLGPSFTFTSSSDRYSACRNPLRQQRSPPGFRHAITLLVCVCVCVCEAMLPLVGYITCHSLTHMPSDATAQLERSRASSFPGLKHRQLLNPAGNKNPTGKILAGPVVGQAVCALRLSSPPVTPPTGAIPVRAGPTNRSTSERR